MGRWTCALMAALAFAACNPKSDGSAAVQPQGEPFSLSIQPPAAGPVGGAFQAEVKVVPRGGYKVNLEYPTRLQVKGPAGVSPGEATLGAKQAATLTAAEILFRPAFKIDAPGDHAFEGSLRFSVCTDKQCEIKNEKVKWVARVPAN